ncbi:MAG: valine--tRNA ligase [Candidatus Omnitrophica bacterium]|nr:valine--tRNA ligase [Candidatus Omnitrophota bacterium]
MSQEPLPTRYNAKESEARWYSHWESQGYFRPASDFTGKKSGQKRYVIVIPPPNVTGILHMGHALNNSIQDILARWHRMKGDDTLWVPGVDHAGIATQNVVEKKLAKEKKTRHDLGREKFLEEVWKWKKEHGDTITRQLRRLGASCDWSRERFTMDEGLSRAVREAFVTLYERGLIYQGSYIINWCPRCQTALSDEESAHKEVSGGLYHIKYPLAGKSGPYEQMGVDHVVVATTRPETMLGDTAVAVHPEDERYKHLIGKYVILPLLNREIPIIADEFVDREFGTGFVKVTPAHDPNDFEMGMRHKLPQINVMFPDGKINENGGPYKGLDRFEARKKMIADLEAQGLFVRRDSHSHAVGHCYRCDTVVEPYLSKQWFVKMKPLAEKALKVHREGKTIFTPDRWTKVYTNWLENIRDWCISRQIWWGHQIPVWYCEGDNQCRLECKKPIVSRKNPSQCPTCGSKNLRQDPDVLDTWFSSWLWPFSTLGWPEKTEDLKHFYPTSDLITAPEIIFFWVARMIMAGLILDPNEVEKTGKDAPPPFSRIYIHGTVRAQSGLKMSKSLGNAIDPLEVIEEIGADGLRFSMIMLSAQDVYLSREKFEVGRNFTNKLWNASRFALMNLEGFTAGTRELSLDPGKLTLAERWILSKLEHKTAEIEKLLGSFALSQAATEIYHFVWNDFCDWFIELAKPTLSGTGSQKESTQKALFYVLEKILRLLHPFMPFITEEIWQKLKEMAQDRTDWPASLMLAPWPFQAEKKFEDFKAEKAIDLVQKTVAGLRDLRISLNIAPAEKLKALVVSPEEAIRKIIHDFEREVKTLGRLESLEIKGEFKKDKSFVGNAFPGFEVFLNIAGVVDPQKEHARIAKKITESKTYIESLKRKLADENFVKRAPADLVEKEKEKLTDAENILKTHEELLALFQ